MNNISKLDKSSNSRGVLLAVIAYALWGVLPVYWKAVKAIPPQEILAHRIIWSFVFITIIMAFRKQLGFAFTIVKKPKLIGYISLCSLLITINWGVYIWAVNSGHIIDASMGYYINPLVSVLLGIFVLKEKMRLNGIIAITLAALGVLYMTYQYGKVPWIALTLALSFAFYGLLKKMIPVDSLTGLLLETAVITPFALIYVLIKQTQGTGAMFTSPIPTVMLLCAGIVTATPLLLFAMSTKLAKLSTIGFVQYFSPSISMVLGVAIYNEKFTLTHVISFGLIWVGILVFAIPQFLPKKVYIKALQAEE